MKSQRFLPQKTVRVVELLDQVDNSLSKFTQNLFKRYARITFAYADRISQTLFEELDKEQRKN